MSTFTNNGLVTNIAKRLHNPFTIAMYKGVKPLISLRCSTEFVFEPTWPFYLMFNLSKTSYFLKRT